jgi:hypothetical protein
MVGFYFQKITVINTETSYVRKPYLKLTSRKWKNMTDDEKHLWYFKTLVIRYGN